MVAGGYAGQRRDLCNVPYVLEWFYRTVAAFGDAGTIPVNGRGMRTATSQCPGTSDRQQYVATGKYKRVQSPSVAYARRQ